MASKNWKDILLLKNNESDGNNKEKMDIESNFEIDRKKNKNKGKKDKKKKNKKNMNKK